MKKLIFILFVTGIATAQTVEKDSLSNDLQEVIIKNETKAFTNKNGNLKMDVASSIYKSVPNVLDLLAKLPKVQISSDRESISVIGKGNPLVYIDNTKATMNDLDALSVDEIKSIEIINNPSAKYEADGKAVILITRKRSKASGFQANFSDTESFKKGSNRYSGISANLKKDKTEIRANFNYNRLNPWESNGNDYEIASEGIFSDYLVAGFTNRRQYVFGTSIFREINSDDYVSLSVNGKIQDDGFRFSTFTSISDNGIENNIRTLGNNNANKDFGNAVLNYNNKIKPANASFFAGLQYSKFGQDSEIFSFNNYNDTQFEPFRNNSQDFSVDAFSAKADFDKKFTNGMKLETGMLFSATVAETGLRMTDFEQGDYSVSDYRMEEKNISGYGQLSGTIKKVSWSLGIRAENTAIIGKYKGADAPLVEKKYTSLFPKAQLEFAVDSTKTLTFNYGKSISRPDYSSTSQGVTYINPYFLFAGNINLNPSISDEISANFQYRDKSLKATFYSTKDNVNYSFLYDEAQDLLTFRPENFDMETGGSIELTLPFSHRFWRVTNVCSFNVNKIEDAGALSNAVKPYLYYYSNHSFKLEKQWAISATGWGITKRYQGILENNAFFILDMAVSKTYKNWICMLAANDIFKNMNFREKFNVSGVSTIGNYYTDTHEISIALKYTFGKIKASEFEEQPVNENLGRIK